jgi:hypothetical protein
VLGKGHLCVDTIAEATGPASATKGPAAASASEPWCAGVSVIVVARHRFRGRIDCLRYISWISYWIFAVCFVVMFRRRPFYIFAAVVLATVGAVHRSRVVSRRGVSDFRKDVILVYCLHVGWGRGMFR